MKYEIIYNNFKAGGASFSDIFWSIKEIYDKEKVRSELLDISEQFNQAVKTIFKKNGLYDQYLYIYILKKFNDTSSVYFQYDSSPSYQYKYLYIENSLKINFKILLGYFFVINKINNINLIEEYKKLLDLSKSYKSNDIIHDTSNILKKKKYLFIKQNTKYEYVYSNVILLKYFNNEIPINNKKFKFYDINNYDNINFELFSNNDYLLKIKKKILSKNYNPDIYSEEHENLSLFESGILKHNFLDNKQKLLNPKMFEKKNDENFKNSFNQYINKIKIFNFLKNNNNINNITNNTSNFINLFNNEKLNNKNIFFKDKYDLSNIYDIDIYFNNFLYFTQLKFEELNKKDLLNLINFLIDLNINKNLTFEDALNIHNFYIKNFIKDVKDLKNYNTENFDTLINFFKSISEEEEKEETEEAEKVEGAEKVEEAEEEKKTKNQNQNQTVEQLTDEKKKINQNQTVEQLTDEKKRYLILHIMNQNYEKIDIDKNIELKDIFILIINNLSNTNINNILKILKNLNINKLNIIIYLYIIEYIKIKLEEIYKDNEYDDINLLNIKVKSIDIEYNKLNNSKKNKIYIINLLQSLINEIKYIINNIILNQFDNYISNNDENNYKNLLDFFINKEKDFYIFKSIEPNNIYTREFEGKYGVRSINFEDILKIDNKSFDLFSENNKSEIVNLTLKYLPYDYNDNHFMFNFLKCMKSLFKDKFEFNFENLDFIADIFKYGKNFYEINNDKNTIEKLNNIINNIYELNNKNSKLKNHNNNYLLNLNENNKKLDENIFSILKNYFFFESKKIFDIYIKTKIIESFDKIYDFNIKNNIKLNAAKMISKNAYLTIPYKYSDYESFLSNDKLEYTINESNKIWDIDTDIDKLFEKFKDEKSRKNFLNLLYNDPLFMLFIKLTKYLKYNFNYKNENIFHSTSPNIDNNKVNNALNNFLNEDRIKIIAVLCIDNYEDLTLFQFHIDKFIILYNALKYEDFKEFKYFNIDLQKLKLYNIYNNININPSKIYNNHSGIVDFLRFISPDFEDSYVFKSERNKIYLSEFKLSRRLINEKIISILNRKGVRSILTQFLEAFDFVKKLKKLKFIENKKLNKLENISKNNKEQLELNINKTINENPIIKEVIKNKNYDSFYQDKSFFNFLKNKYDLNKLYLTQLVVAGAITRELDGHIQMLNLKLNINDNIQMLNLILNINDDIILDDFFKDKNINNIISKITEELPFVFQDIKITDRQIDSYIKQFNNRIIKSNNYFNTFADISIIENFDLLS